MSNPSSSSSIGRDTRWNSLPEAAERRWRQNRMARRKQHEGQYEATKHGREDVAHIYVDSAAWEQTGQFVSMATETDLAVSINVKSSSHERNTSLEALEATELTSTSSNLLAPSSPDMPEWFSTSLVDEMTLFDLEQNTAAFDKDASGEHEPSHSSCNEVENHNVVGEGAELEEQLYAPFESSLMQLDMCKGRAELSIFNSITLSSGFTALHKGAMYGHANMVRLLLESGANPEVRNHDGRTPLHLAAGRGRVDILSALLDAGADIEAQDKAGERPLHITAIHGHIAAAQLLISKGARVDAQDGQDGQDGRESAK